MTGQQYALGGDPSNGKADFSAAWVFDVPSLRACARIHTKCIPTDFAGMLDTLGRYYNIALITVETPGPGTTVLEQLYLNHNYPNLYVYEDKLTGDVKDELTGWPQNVKTRQIAIGMLQKYTKAMAYSMPDEATVRELSSITWRGVRKRLRAEAAEGGHDDLVFALIMGLIAYERILENRPKFATAGAGYGRVAKINQGYVYGEAMGVPPGDYGRVRSVGY